LSSGSAPGIHLKDNQNNFFSSQDISAPISNIMNKAKHFGLLLLSSIGSLACIVMLNNQQQQQQQQQRIQQFDDSADLTLPSIFQWLPNTEMKPLSLVPKFKISKDRYSLHIL
jgi:hypothetical protein